MKNKKNNIATILSIVVCLLPIILGVILYNNLPEEIPIHFSIDSVPDLYANKNFVLFFIPVIMTFFQAFILLVNYAVSSELEKKPKFLSASEWIIPAFTILMYTITVLISLGINIPVGKIVCLFLGIMFIIMGFYTSTIDYETAKSFSYPAPKDEKAFRKMNIISKYISIIIGIIFLFLTIWV